MAAPGPTEACLAGTAEGYSPRVTNFALLERARTRRRATDLNFLKNTKSPGQLRLELKLNLSLLQKSRVGVPVPAVDSDGARRL